MNQIDYIIKKLNAQEVSFKDLLILQIKDLPQNLGIKPLGSTIFTVSSGDVAGCMSPEYHDWKWQHSFVIDLIRAHPLATLNQIIRDLCDEKTAGSYWHRRSNVSHRFHPEVIQQFKEIFEI